MTEQKLRPLFLITIYNLSYATSKIVKVSHFNTVFNVLVKYEDV